MYSLFKSDKLSTPPTPFCAFNHARLTSSAAWGPWVQQCVQSNSRPLKMKGEAETKSRASCPNTSSSSSTCTLCHNFFLSDVLVLSPFPSVVIPPICLLIIDPSQLANDQNSGENSSQENPHRLPCGCAEVGTNTLPATLLPDPADHMFPEVVQSPGDDCFDDIRNLGHKSFDDESTGKVEECHHSAPVEFSI